MFLKLSLIICLAFYNVINYNENDHLNKKIKLPNSLFVLYQYYSIF